MLISNNEIPGFAAAIKAENDIRDAAFLDIPTRIGMVGTHRRGVLAASSGEIELRQMTPLDLLILDGIGNPLMSGQLPTPAQLAQFLLILRLPICHRPSAIVRYLHARRVRKFNYLLTVRQCADYIRQTFQDSPPSSGFSSTPYAGWCAHLVNALAREYAWPEQTILRTPLKRLWQYLKCIRRFHDPDSPTHNPSDKCKGDHLRLLNARATLLQTLKRRMSN